MAVPVPMSAVGLARSLERRDVQQLAELVGLPELERQKLHENGLVEIPVATAGLIDLLAEVIDDLTSTGWRAEACRSVIFTHSLALGRAEAQDVENLLLDRLCRLDSPPILVTGRPCSVIHLGIELALGECRRNPTGTVLVLGADLAPTVDERFFFGSAMGDAAVGVALGDTAPFAQVLSVRSTHRILAADGALSEPEQIERFRAQNPSAIRATVEAALTAAGLGWPDLAAIVPHTPYHQIWDVIASLCRYPREQILDQGLNLTGHLNSNDVLVHLANTARTGRLREGQNVALLSPGFGGTRGCTIIRYEGGV